MNIIACCICDSDLLLIRVQAQQLYQIMTHKLKKFLKIGTDNELMRPDIVKQLRNRLKYERHDALYIFASVNKFELVV